MALADDLAKAIAKVLEGRGVGGETTTTRREGETDTEFKARSEARLSDINEEQAKLDKLRETNLDIQDIEFENLRLAKARLELVKEYTDPETYANVVRSLQAQEAGLNAGVDAAKRYLGVTGQQNSMLAQLAVGGKEYASSAVKGFKGATAGAAIAAATIDKVVEASIELAVAQDAANVQFAKATGQGAAFNSTIMDLEENLYTAGVTSAEASQAVQGLFQNVSSFTAMSKSQQRELGETVAVLQELGVNAQNSTKNIQIATKVLGMSTGQASALQREMFVFAQGLGVSVDQMSQDFHAMGPQIAALGKNGVQAFKDLQIQAKNTGMQVSELVSITEKFDKFDTAADSVARLNAILGGPYLNTLEMVAETDPSKRFEMLKKGIDAAGISFDSMDYYQRKAVASAAGLNEQQLALLMRGSLDQIIPKPKSAADIEALAKQTAQFNTVMEEMGQIMRSFAISFGPVVSSFKGMLQIFGDLTPILILIGLGFAPITGAIGTITGGILLLTQAWRFLTHGLQYGFSMTPAAALGMTAEAIDGVTASMNNMPTSKTVDVMSNIAHSVDASGMNGVTRGAQGGAAAVTTVSSAASGPPPVININLQIDGKEFAAVVNDVSVEKYSGGKPSEMYASIISMIEQGFVRGT